MISCQSRVHNIHHRMYRSFVGLVVLLFVILPCFNLKAENSSTSRYEAGVFVGPLLSEDVTGVSEIVQLTGVRFSHPLWSTLLEYQVSAGNSYGISYRLLSLQIRQPLDFDFIKTHWILGFDAHSYKSSTPSAISASPMGWHAGFGTTMDLSSSLYVRSDLHFGLSPGLQLLLNFGVGFAF